MFGKIAGWFVQVAMVTPNDEGVYAPSGSNNQPVHKEFSTEHARDIPVSYEPDGMSNPQDTTVYGHGLDCWYAPTDRTETTPDKGGWSWFGGKVK